MSKNLIIIGMGPGLSIGLAEKFGQSGFRVGMVSRSAEKLAGYQAEFSRKGIDSLFATADAYSSSEVEAAVNTLNEQLGGVDLLVYNAAALKMKPILTETPAELAADFQLSVSNAFAATQALLPTLRERKGAVLLTGGGFALYPNAQFGSLSLGKAGLRSLAYILNDALQPDGVYVGTVTIQGYIQHGSDTHSPALLADTYWELYQSRDRVEAQV
jgi:short-subunit dehydrogenase